MEPRELYPQPELPELPDAGWSNKRLKVFITEYGGR
jgi:hypothetical protein